MGGDKRLRKFVKPYRVDDGKKFRLKDHDASESSGLEKEKAELKANSPAFLAKSLKLPLFIAHGEDDSRAEVEHAWRLKSAVEAGGGTVDWLLLPKEGHGFSKPKNIEEFYQRLDAFFAKHLGDG